MEKTIYVAVKMDIPTGNLEQLKNMLPSINELVNSGEPKTELYQWYINEDQTKCTLLERFPSEEAFLAHLQNVGPALEDLFATAPVIGWEIHGSISDEVIDSLKTFGSQYNVVPLFGKQVSGFTRSTMAASLQQ